MSIEQVHGIYFFDEFDAIGAHRSSQNDVGEIRRVLNSFLQFLEQSNSDSLILAATNNLDLLDKALFRRFDDVIEYQIPNKDLAIQSFKNLLTLIDASKVDFIKVGEASSGLSYAEIAKISEDAVKNVVLSERRIQLTTDIVLKSIVERSASR